MENSTIKLRDYLNIIIDSEEMGDELDWIFDLFTEKLTYTPDEIINYHFNDIVVYYQIIYKGIIQQEYEICELCRNIIRIKTINIKKLSSKKLNEDDFNEVIQQIRDIELTHLHNIKNLIKNGGK